MLFDCPCFAAGRLRSDPEATIRAITWETMTGRVPRGDQYTMAVDIVLNCGQDLPLCVHPNKTPEGDFIECFSAGQIFDSLFRPQRRSVERINVKELGISE